MASSIADKLSCVGLKVVLIVRRDLNMKPGKIGAQCAHAAVGLYKVTVAQRAPWLSAWEVCKTFSASNTQAIPTWAS